MHTLYRLPISRDVTYAIRPEIRGLKTIIITIIITNCFDNIITLKYLM